MSEVLHNTKGQVMHNVTVKALIKILKEIDENCLISVSIPELGRNYLVTDIMRGTACWDGAKPKSISEEEWNGAPRSEIHDTGPRVAILYCDK